MPPYTITLNQTLYARLAVPPDAAIDEIRRAWKRAAFEHHPDRDGDPDVFRLALEAWETLSDPVRRAIYDLRPVPRPRPTCVLARWHADHGSRMMTEEEVRTWAMNEAPELLNNFPRCLWTWPKITPHHRLRTRLWYLGGRSSIRVWWAEDARQPPL